MKSTAEILREARALIDTPEKWIRGNYALDAEGDAVMPEGDDAVCFCLTGALWHAHPDGPWREFDALRAALDGTNIISFNDRPATSHADVLAAFDRAIALAETQA